MKTRQLYALLIAALMLVVPQGVGAQECFTYKNNGTTIDGLTAYGMAATELTIPASVETVSDGAFYNGRVQILTIDGGNPLFEENVLSDVNSSLISIDAGSGMTAANIKNMLASLVSRGNLEEVVIAGFHDEVAPTINWTDINAVLTEKVGVKMPAALVSDQVFGNATVYGRFTVSGELATFCGSATFEDDGNSNMLFYVPQKYQQATKQVYIKRVYVVTAGQGVLIHNAIGTSTYADLKRINEGEEYSSNMLVGVTEPTTIEATDGDKTNLILYQGAFHPTSGGIIPANRAYLQILTSEWDAMNVRQLTFNFDDLETGIEVVTEGTNVTGMYDLTGRKVSMPRKGVYIQNGRKTFIK